MEVGEMPTPGCKFPRIRNGNTSRTDSAKVGKKRDEQYTEEDGDGEAKRATNVNGTGAGGVVGGGSLDITSPGGLGRLCGWPSSRIVRVSRASGGKDRHSKVWTSKGLRDRRVRLSVNTAIQFYDLQDRLGYDQPSKAVEWLLKAAASSIAELPSINTSFPDTPQQVSDEKRSSTVGTEHGFDSAEVEMEGELYQHQPQQQQQEGGNNFSRSACSSTSETSKGSGLSLSRSESRIKARERARERAAEKEKEKGHQNVNPISQSSFTELLTGGMNNSSNVNSANTNGNNNASSSPNRADNGTPTESNLFQKSPRQWSSTPMDYFPTGLLGLSSARAASPSSTSFFGQIQLGNHIHQSLSGVSSSPLFSVTGEHHSSELQHFCFVPDHLVPVAVAGNSHTNNSTSNGNGSDYNLNFTISPSSSSGFAGFNRGTLQSNSSSPTLILPHQGQSFSSNIDRPSSSAFFTTTTSAAQPPNAAVAPVEDHHHHHHHQHHFLPGFDARLQLCYGDAGRHSEQKGKVKN